MQIKIRKIQEHLIIVHFSISYNEIIKKYNEIKVTNSLNDEDATFSLHFYIESEMLNDKLLDEGYIAIESHVRYLSDFHNGRPIIGVANMIVFPKEYQISVPMSLPTAVFAEINESFSRVDESFNQTLSAAGLVNYFDTDIVTENSVVYYQLLYTKDGIVLNTINNQMFDMSLDDDLEPTLLKGAKIGDKIIIDQDDLNIEVLITDIKIKAPMTKDNYDKEKLSRYDCEDFDDLYKKYCEAYRQVNKIEILFEYIISICCELEDFEVTEELMEHFEDVVFFIYRDEYYEAETEEQRKKAIKKEILLSLINALIVRYENGNDQMYDLTKNTHLYSSLYEYLHLGEDDSSAWIEFAISIGRKISILKYFINKKLIKGLSLDL